jgi:DNA-binding transcriptional LysR family regulator
MRLQQLELLVTLAEQGSLRAAAEVLNITQPALSKSLRRLEEEFGAALVQRSAKGVRLTQVGELLAARAVTVIREVARAHEDVSSHLGNTTGRVTVGLSPAVAVLFSPGAVARFRRRWPHARVCIRDVLYPQALHQLRRGDLDFVLGPVPATGVGADLLCQVLFHSQEVIGARRGHPLAKVRKLKDLSDASWILVGPARGPGDPQHLHLEERGMPLPKVPLECESFFSLLSLMPTQDVIGIMPRSFLNRHGRRAGLVSLPIEDPLPITTIYAVSRSDAPLSLPAQDLLEAFMQEAREVVNSQLK